MCTPVAAVMGLQAVASYAGQQQATQANNEAALANAQSASIAAGYKYADNNARYAYNARSLQREAYKAAMEGRARESTGVASAGSAGVSGISLGALIADTRRQAAENAYVAGEKRADLFQSTILNNQAAEAEAQGRINSFPMASGPSPLGLAINLGDAVVQGGKSKGWWG